MLLALIYKIFNRLFNLDKRFSDLENKLDDRFDGLELSIEQILAAVSPLPAVRLVFDTTMERQLQIGAIQMVIKDTQKFTASIRPVDAKGNPALVQDGSVQWTGPDFLTVTPSADGLSADVSAKGPLGSGQLSVSADADLGDGVTTITGVLQVDVLAGQAVSLSVDSSTPAEQ